MARKAGKKVKTIAGSLVWELRCNLPPHSKHQGGLLPFQKR
jgi:hypothetical protein